MGDTGPPASYLAGGGAAGGSGGGAHDDAAADDAAPLLGAAAAAGGGGGAAARAYERTSAQRAPGALSTIVGFPLWAAAKALSIALRPVSYVLGAEEAPKDGEAAARRFIAAFEAQYGRGGGGGSGGGGEGGSGGDGAARVPRFFPDSYRQAVAAAAVERKNAWRVLQSHRFPCRKQQSRSHASPGGALPSLSAAAIRSRRSAPLPLLPCVPSPPQFLLVYLHSPLHEDTPDFCKTLTSETMAEFMAQNFLAWGGSVWHADAYSVSNQLGACTYPFMALLLCSPDQVQVMERFEGKLSCEAILERAGAAMARFQDQLDRARRAQAERDQARRLREEQDAEFHAALEADRRLHEDRERERRDAQRAEAEAQRQVELAAAQEADEADRRAQRLRELRDGIGQEPPPGPQATRLRMQLPNGTKLDRRFAKDAPLRAVQDFLELHFLEAPPGARIARFSMNTNYPKRTYAGADDLAASLDAAGLHPQALLLILDLDA
ncbi:hypothetical protein JKP88DRAFT_266399 [Tribonema minus]|uniref:UBX domain-containing protein n=1 Tax=Tribonema minus TaxID=303371 RepID=A0A835ZEV9_9STRA|nr:hypothetical protein JKP88DRAFT_266399 [Tribonema minus]